MLLRALVSCAVDLCSQEETLLDKVLNICGIPTSGRAHNTSDSNRLYITDLSSQIRLWQCPLVRVRSGDHFGEQSTSQLNSSHTRVVSLACVCWGGDGGCELLRAGAWLIEARAC